MARFADVSEPLSTRSAARQSVAIPFSWHHCWDGFQLIDVEPSVLFEKAVDVRLISSIFAAF
jgi:hypothetical protein